MQNMNNQEYKINWETTQEILGKAKNNLVNKRIYNLYDLAYESHDYKNKNPNTTWKNHVMSCSWNKL